MSKKYIKPSVEAIEIELQAMICTSTLSVASEGIGEEEKFD